LPLPGIAAGWNAKLAVARSRRISRNAGPVRALFRRGSRDRHGPSPRTKRACADFAGPM